MTVPLPDPNTEDCRALSSILARVGAKWTVLIVVLLGDGPKRFNEIKRMVGGISQRMLTLTLRGLEREGEHSLRNAADRKSTRLNSSHSSISYAVFCLKKKNTLKATIPTV